MLGAPIKIKVYAVALLLMVSLSALAEDRMIWKKVPLIVTLVPDQERIVVFPKEIEKLSVPDDLKNFVRIEVLDDRVFLLANSVFKKIRVRVYAGGQVYLLDFIGLEAGRRDVALIVDGPSQTGYTESQKNNTTLSSEVALVRHAAQTLYSPKRLMPTDRAGIFRTSRLAQSLDFPLYRLRNFEYRLLGEWQGSNLFVSAIRVTNRESVTRYLDPRQIRGQWRARAWQHPWIGPAGEDTDTTTLYLLSELSFEKTFPEALVVKNDGDKNGGL